MGGGAESGIKERERKRAAEKVDAARPFFRALGGAERMPQSLFLFLLSFSSYHLRAPALHRRDAVHKVRGLAFVRLLFFVE